MKFRNLLALFVVCLSSRALHQRELPGHESLADLEGKRFNSGEAFDATLQIYNWSTSTYTAMTQILGDGFGTLEQEHAWQIANSGQYVNASNSVKFRFILTGSTAQVEAWIDTFDVLVKP
jgi:hypothetical protein